MQANIVGLVAISLIAVFSSGCASITKGTSQTLTVDTRPPGAECRLEREGNQLAVINPTPGSISVDKDKDPISVTCRKESFQPAVAVMDSSFQAMTLGNVIFGGLIGVAIDAGTGAANQYESLVTLTLIPESFATGEQRDTFFDSVIAGANDAADMERDKIQDSCSTGCDGLLGAAERRREARLADIERQRSSAVIDPSSEDVAQGAES